MIRLTRLLAVAAMVSGLSFADQILATYEPAGVVLPLSSVICAGTATCVLGTEDFNAWQGGGFSTDFGTGNQITGTYSGGLLSYAADQFGGAGGAGRYPVIFSTGGSYTLTLSTAGVPGVNYFGLWLSALDSGNLLQFYSGNTLVYEFTPADLISLVGACSAANPFCANPSGAFKGQDSGEQFAYLNFYDMNGYFDKIVFSESGGGGLESDNHTVAYMDPPIPTGTEINAPEPATLSLAAAAAFLLALARRRLLTH
jgi:hypothetical protein